jgi:phosphoglycerate-specific signal transduction histidine kinase
LARVETHLKLRDINRKLEEKVERRTDEILATQKKLILSEELASLGTLMAGVAAWTNRPKANCSNLFLPPKALMRAQVWGYRYLMT